MPHPDPNGLSIDEREDGSFSITAEVWQHGNRQHRIAWMRAVARNIACGGWRCRRCGTEIALFKRSDARYCGERCRKVVARRRRAEKQPMGTRRSPISHDHRLEAEGLIAGEKKPTRLCSSQWIER